MSEDIYDYIIAGVCLLFMFIELITKCYHINEKGDG